MNPKKNTVYVVASSILLGLGVIFFSLAITQYQVLINSRADEPITCGGTAVGQCVGAKRCATNPADDGKYYNWCVKCGANGQPEQNEQGTGECCGNCGTSDPGGTTGGQCTDSSITSSSDVCTKVCGLTPGGTQTCSPGGMQCGTGCAYFDPNNNRCGTCQGTAPGGWNGLCNIGTTDNFVTVHTGTTEDNTCPISANAHQVTVAAGSCYSPATSCEQADPNGGGGTCIDTGCSGPPENTPVPTTPPESTPTARPTTPPENTPTSTPSPLPCVTNFNVVCATAGTSATISWTGNTGAASYIIRLNHEPYDPPTNWFNAAQGDQWITSTGAEKVVQITPGVNYEYDIQPVKPAEPTPYQGLRCPFARFICAAPTNTPTLTPTLTHTPTPTKTPIPPTNTPNPTATLVPTNTPTPTPVPPTNTPVPPTITPTPTQKVIVLVNTPTPTPVTQLVVNEQAPGFNPWFALLIPFGLVLLGLAL